MGELRAGGGCEKASPPPAMRTITPENFGNFMCKMGHFGAKLHHVLIANKVQF